MWPKEEGPFLLFLKVTTSKEELSKHNMWGIKDVNLSGRWTGEEKLRRRL